MFDASPGKTQHARQDRWTTVANDISDWFQGWHAGAQHHDGVVVRSPQLRQGFRSVTGAQTINRMEITLIVE
jgi:hypothetical protein